MSKVPNGAHETLETILSPAGPYRVRNRHRTVMTLNILLTFLSRYRVLQRPGASPTPKRFTWCQTLATHGDIELLDEADPRLLYICSSEHAPAALEADPLAFLLVVTRDDAVPDWAERNRNRLVLVRAEDRFIFVAATVQNLFTRLLVWEDELDRIVAIRGSLGDLLNEGSRALNNFMCITDSGYNLIAHSTVVEPSDDNMRYLVENGCYAPAVIEYLETNVLPACMGATRPLVDDACDITDRTVVHFPVYFNDNYFFHLFMPCSSELEVEAASDFLGLFSERLVALCATFWDDILEVESPWHRVLTNFIDRVPMNDTYVATQLNLTAIPQAQQFKLYCIKVDPKAPPSLQSRIVSSARLLNGGACYPFAYNGFLLVLCYSQSANFSAFSPARCAEDLSQAFPPGMGLRTGISRAFTNVADIAHAYLQARLALNFARCVDAECILAGRPRAHLCYAYESVLPYYLLVSTCRNDSFAYESIRHGVIDHLAAEDRKQGTSIVRLLWTYLNLERNATAACKQLHMHRNTVLYHIEKIERSFAITLDDPITRMSLLEEFRLYFLTDQFTRDVDFGKLVDIVHSEERTLE